MNMAQVVVVLDRQTAQRRWQFGLNVWEYAIEELLDRTGIPYEVIDNIEALAERDADLVLAAVVPEHKRAQQLLWDYVEQGGTLVGWGNMQMMGAPLGAALAQPMEAGYASLAPEDGWNAAGPAAPSALRHLGARPWTVEADNPHLVSAIGKLHKERPDGEQAGAVIQQFRIGEGTFERWSVDLFGTIVRMQQGADPVLDDGIPAPDGTAPVQDGILKADDRCALDWEHDRVTTETGVPYFAYPYADLWRELFVSRLLRLALKRGRTLPFVGYWPDGVARVATISHDSDGNKDEHAVATMELLAQCGVQTTWCMLEPGYSSDLYKQIDAAGHELAFHYNALEQDKGFWDGAEFDRQFGWLQQAVGRQTFSSNKNHYTRFEGWGALFAWCEKNGLICDQTRGPSKKGNVGFLFGTCHPYTPLAWADEQNRRYNVMELSFLTQDLDLSHHWPDSSVIEPFLQGAASVNGVAHFLFHQVHIHNRESVREALRSVVNGARAKGFVFWTSEQIVNWERSRRQIALAVAPSEDKPFAVQQPVAGAVVWEPVADDDHTGDIQIQYGVRCRKHVLGA